MSDDSDDDDLQSDKNITEILRERKDLYNESDQEDN